MGFHFFSHPCEIFQFYIHLILTLLVAMMERSLTSFSLSFKFLLMHSWLCLRILFDHIKVIEIDCTIFSKFSSLIFHYLIILKLIYHIWLCCIGQILFRLITLPTASLLKSMFLVIVFFFKITYVVLKVCCMPCNVS